VRVWPAWASGGWRNTSPSGLGDERGRGVEVGLGCSDEVGRGQRVGLGGGASEVGDGPGLPVKSGVGVGEGSPVEVGEGVGG
jgi:hypothetical protein